MMKMMKLVVIRVVQTPRFGLEKIALLALLMGAAALLTSCDSSSSSSTSAGTPMEEGVTAAKPSGAMWPAYYAPIFFEHGYGPEDRDRDAAISGALAAGVNCLWVDAPTPPSDEAAMHLLHFSSPVDGHFLTGNWYDIAASRGIYRYIINVGNGANLERWKFLTKDYPANTIQWLVNDVVVPQ